MYSVISFIYVNDWLQKKMHYLILQTKYIKCIKLWSYDNENERIVHMMIVRVL